MKAIAYLLIGFVSIFCFMGISSLKAEASDYIGEFCWQVAEDGQMRGIIKFGISYIGGSYYSFQAGTPQGSNGYRSSNGTAQLAGKQFIMTMSKTASDGILPATDAGIGQCQIVFDLTTLNGSGWCIETSYLPANNGNIYQAYQTQTFTYTQCP